MAFDATQFSLQSHTNGFRRYRYDTTDAPGTVDNTGYINNVTNGQNLKVGDTVEVFQWNTAVRTGTIADVSYHVVMRVAANGDVDLSTDVTSWAPASGD